ncbi:SLAM family member 6-like isoform X2 [Melanotaenia boesemani]|uniref:SLAM family member 6-like isoform X2 n=1 Tax=Melanotaenia boesemani TaxID=1250792 RepID=UPI001C055DB0|nr:SLAM family member 6-like isoform X2 [Melanotaenia boesemani]
MMAAGPVVLLVAFLLNPLQAQDSELFVLRGSNLHLDVKKPVKLTDETYFVWKFNDSRVVRFTHNKQTTIFPSYKENVDFSEGNYSLQLKNLQHSNSGIYKAVVSGEKDVIVTEYRLTIQDKVSSVKLTVTPNNSSSSSSCNLTVTCSTEDSSISTAVHCDNQTCSLVKKPNLKPPVQTSSIIVYLQQDYIICNHSNQVSWKHNNKELKSYCKTEQDAIVSAAIRITAGVLTAILAVACTVIVYIKCKRKSNENTGNDISQEMEMSQNVYQRPDDASDLHPTTTYSMIQFPAQPVNSAETKHTLSETVYAQVQRHDNAKR